MKGLWLLFFALSLSFKPGPIFLAKIFNIFFSTKGFIRAIFLFSITFSMPGLFSATDEQLRSYAVSCARIEALKDIKLSLITKFFANAKLVYVPTALKDRDPAATISLEEYTEMLGEAIKDHRDADTVLKDGLKACIELYKNFRNYADSDKTLPLKKINAAWKKVCSENPVIFVGQLSQKSIKENFDAIRDCKERKIIKNVLGLIDVLETECKQIDWDLKFYEEERSRIVVSEEEIKKIKNEEEIETIKNKDSLLSRRQETVSKVVDWSKQSARGRIQHAEKDAFGVIYGKKRDFNVAIQKQRAINSNKLRVVYCDSLKARDTISREEQAEWKKIVENQQKDIKVVKEKIDNFNNQRKALSSQEFLERSPIWRQEDLEFKQIEDLFKAERSVIEKKDSELKKSNEMQIRQLLAEEKLSREFLEKDQDREFENLMKDVESAKKQDLEKKRSSIKLYSLIGLSAAVLSGAVYFVWKKHAEYKNKLEVQDKSKLKEDKKSETKISEKVAEDIFELAK